MRLIFDNITSLKLLSSLFKRRKISQSTLNEIDELINDMTNIPKVVSRIQVIYTKEYTFNLLYVETKLEEKKYFKNAMRVWLYFESLMIVYDKKKKIKLLFFLICSHKLYNYFEGDLFSKTNSKKFPSICIRVPEVIKDWFLHEHTDKDTYSHT